MLGLLDKIAIVLYKKDRKNNSSLNFSSHFIDRSNEEIWICFLPWKTSYKKSKLFSLFPPQGNLLVYEIPDAILSAEPKLVVEAIKYLKKDLRLNEKKYKLKSSSLNFLGISAGTIPAIYFAQYFENQKLTIVCPTDKLGESIFFSKAAQDIKKKIIEKGYSIKKYDKIIGNINPIMNYSKILSNQVEIYLARFDHFTPFLNGLNLAEKIRTSKIKKIKIKKFNFLGHTAVIIIFGFLNLKQKILKKLFLKGRIF